MTIDELLETYELFAMTELEKGERFERLMKNFLLTYPVWRGTVANVWRWKEFPFRDELGGKDLGIDLVVKTVSGDYRAVQCKFYAESSTISKEAVDSFFSNATRTFDGDKKFSSFIWISTTDNYTDNAREMFKGRENLKIIDLATLRRVQVNWALLDNNFSGENAIVVRKLRDYQIEAVNAAQIHYQNHNRGQLIMACGTGKTFTALRIAESLAPDGKILFLVPSISLLNQTLEEWATFAVKPLNALCICSDATAADLDEDAIPVNLPLPAMTDAKKIADALKNLPQDRLTVLFATYQSIEVVHALNLTFDLVICDEAHRTAVAVNEMHQIKKSSKNQSALGENTAFTAVHDENFIKTRRRMYMTATPKLFKTETKDYAREKDLTLWSMDDEKTFGEKFFTITFGEAKDRGYLADYKVLVFTVDETVLTSRLKQAVYDKNQSLTFDNALKIIGCINALSKKLDDKSARLVADDKNVFMHTAVAFCKTIDDAERFSDDFAAVQEKFFDDMPEFERKNFVTVDADFVYGSRKVGRKLLPMNAALRAAKLHKLKKTPLDGNKCTVLHNVRCLSEGVDVPALDAIIFFASKRSEVEIVQAVGRVMRTAAHKNFGYIIIPVVVPMNKSPEEALDNNSDFKDVWRIINALRSHDYQINIEIERLRNTGISEKIIIGKPKSDFSSENATSKPEQLSLLHFFRWEDFKDKIYARMVEHVGDTLYWIQWAYKVSDIVERHTRRIAELISVDGEHKRDFDDFLDNLRKNLNPAVSAEDAMDMLAQQLATRPIFEGLFENYSFVNNNPVSVAMQNILNKLEGDGMTKDRDVFAALYKQVKLSCSGMGDNASRQRIITKIYQSFFSFALKKTADKLGIVYTPVEVVDFILRSVDAVLKKNFNRSITDKNVHVLDPFTGTGTFIVRLIQSGLIRDFDLPRKFFSELHANEIVLLAYYIAAVNIENAYNSIRNYELGIRNDNDAKTIPNSSFLIPNCSYQPFAGICFTDTFELYERGEKSLNLDGVMKINSERVNLQKNSRIDVIVGNPPYSVGQKSANDNNQNQRYKNLEARIAKTYAANTAATNKNALYDSYIKAFRWASDRISEGIIGFVTNAGWIDGAAMDGLRKCFANEFAEIYVFNLRGNKRTMGELQRKERQNIFGQGTRAPVAVTILVKAPHEGSAKIFYRDIGDYLTREQKLSEIERVGTVLSGEFKIITPNERFDWINQRGNTFEKFIPLHESQIPKYGNSFNVRSNGVQTNRDAWCYNFSRKALESTMRTTIDYYNSHSPTEIDPKKFVWTSSAVANKNRGREITFDAAKFVESMYRPFCKTNFYYDELLNHRRYQMPKIFPTGREENLLICVSGVGSSKDFSVLMTDKITDVQFQFNGQCFPLYFYKPTKEINMFGENYERRDGISDEILQLAMRNEELGIVTKEDIFYYVYGFLHLPSYREKFSAELKKSLPRIILVAEAQKFWHLSRAGRELAEIHLNYETQPPAEVQLEIRNEELGIKIFQVEKMKFARDDRTTLIYNRHIKIKNIPPRSFGYVVNGRSPLEWLIDRYQIKTDKASGIINNPNDWGLEHDNPRYILDLILSCITVSLKTLDIVENLPEVDFDA